MYSNEGLLTEAQKVFKKEALKLAPAYLMLQMLPLFRQSLEDTAHSHVVGAWSSRAKAIKDNIKSWTAKIPAPFSEDKINKDPRFPASRIGQADGKYYDMWLTVLLKSKPILFDSPQYVDHSVECFQKVYLVEHDKEQKGQQSQTLAVEGLAKQEQPQPYSETPIPQSELEAMWERPELDYGMRELHKRGRI
jgi:hypothetical protein